MDTFESIMRTVVAADIEPPFSTASTARGAGQRTSDARIGRGRIRWLLALMLCGLLIGGGAWAVQWLLATKQFLVAHVRIDGEIRHTTQAALQDTLTRQMSENFFALNLNVIRHALESLPWIAEARVRRVWPLTLVIWVQEREALAHWGDHSLVSPDGIVFTPDPQSIPAELNYLQGPNGSVLHVIDRYRWLQERLAAHGLKIARLTLSDRHAWYLDLTSGLKLSLGTKDLESRIERFLRYLPRLPQPEALEQVDLRYINGFAARWRTLPATVAH